MSSDPRNEQAELFYRNWLKEQSCETSGHRWDVVENFGGEHQVFCEKCGYFWSPTKTQK